MPRVRRSLRKPSRRPRKLPSQTWRAFLTNHVGTLVSVDFFTVATATFRLLFVFVVLLHFSTVLSRLSEQNKTLAQQLALLEEKLRSKDEKRPRRAA